MKLLASGEREPRAALEPDYVAPGAGNARRFDAQARPPQVRLGDNANANAHVGGVRLCTGGTRAAGAPPRASAGLRR